MKKLKNKTLFIALVCCVSTSGLYANSDSMKQAWRRAERLHKEAKRLHNEKMDEQILEARCRDLRRGYNQKSVEWLMAPFKNPTLPRSGPLDSLYERTDFQQ